jgi:hypothetical protein
LPFCSSLPPSVRPFIHTWYSGSSEFLAVFIASVSGVNQNWDEFLAHARTVPIYVSMAAQIVTDVLIALTSLVIFRTQRSEYERTRSVMNRVLSLTLGACLVPTMFAFVRLIVVSNARVARRLAERSRVGLTHTLFGNLTLLLDAVQR